LLTCILLARKAPCCMTKNALIPAQNFIKYSSNVVFLRHQSVSGICFETSEVIQGCWINPTFQGINKEEYVHIVNLQKNIQKSVRFDSYLLMV
jgi:hypothetical protein